MNQNKKPSTHLMVLSHKKTETGVLAGNFLSSKDRHLTILGVAKPEAAVSKMFGRHFSVAASPAWGDIFPGVTEDNVNRLMGEAIKDAHIEFGPRVSEALAAARLGFRKK
ncbi:hypothetical protein RP726_05575 [Candidatus Methylospira mobilis]|uniref:hypothetical protein n=1 Tax=Candidatus Methylospira mobilis TaxID=1808979 RepID=UPI0028EF254A|nr:hypothetical protein [Candidatus Methylospira mobilis]WNV05881.1 hypothetical protein RP726_05575 [Candidatus Methylospira mobilis]